ncbi:hypothetical protein FD876_18975, partial [Acinetobacter baumannii]
GGICQCCFFRPCCGASDAGRALPASLAPQHGRKKQHWQIPPVTRVRVRKRIRRWDGYLCVLHL